jgi:hypothetical protein
MPDNGEAQYAASPSKTLRPEDHRFIFTKPGLFRPIAAA